MNDEHDLRTAAYHYERRIRALTDLLRDMWPRAAYTMSRRERDAWRGKLRDVGVEVDE